MEILGEGSGHLPLALTNDSVAEEEGLLLGEVSELTGEDLDAFLVDEPGDVDSSLRLAVAVVFNEKCRHHAVEIQILALDVLASDEV